VNGVGFITKKFVTMHGHMNVKIFRDFMPFHRGYSSDFGGALPSFETEELVTTTNSKHPREPKSSAKAL
jgi:hypothetical protein